MLLVRVETDAGITGWGESFGHRIFPATRAVADMRYPSYFNRESWRRLASFRAIQLKMVEPQPRLSVIEACRIPGNPGKRACAIHVASEPGSHPEDKIPTSRVLSVGAKEVCRVAKSAIVLDPCVGRESRRELVA